MGLPLIRSTTGLNLYAVFSLRSTGQMRDVAASAWDTIASGDWGDYDVPLTELGGSGYYRLASLPSGLSEDDELDMFVHRRAGASPASTDDAIVYVRFPELAPEALLGTPDNGTLAADLLAIATLLATVNSTTQSTGATVDEIVEDTGSTLPDLIGTPDEGSVSADLAQNLAAILQVLTTLTSFDTTISPLVSSIDTNVDELLDLVGTPDNGTLSADHEAIAALAAAINSATQSIKAQTDLLAYVSGSLRAKLAADGLDDVDVSAVSGPATTLGGMIVQLWRRRYKRATIEASGGSGSIKTYDDDGTTVLTTQAISDDGSTQEQGSAT